MAENVWHVPPAQPSPISWILKMRLPTRLPWLQPPPPPPAPPPPPSSALHLWTGMEWDELFPALQEWVLASFCCLLVLVTLHVCVRISGHLGYGRTTHATTLPVRLAWATLFAIFPEGEPTNLRSTAEELVGRFVERLGTRRRLSAQIESLRTGGGDSPAGSGLSQSLPALPRMSRRASFGGFDLEHVKRRGTMLLVQAGHHFEYALSVALLDLAIAATAPVAFGAAGPTLQPFRASGQVGLSGLVAARVVAPLGHALRATCQGVLDEWKTCEDAALTYTTGARQMVDAVPSAVQGALWLLWAVTLGSVLGVDVSAMWASLGWGGVLAGLALQHHAADVVGGITLLSDGRFALGDLITLGAPPGWTVTVRQVGLLKTSCVLFDSGFACAIPNSTLVRSPIYNWERFKERRVVVDLVLDASTATPDKLGPLPLALLEAARAAARAAKFADVTFGCEEQGDGVEIVDAADAFGVRVQLIALVPRREGDPTRWKRAKSAMLVGMLRELEARGIALGRTRTSVLHDTEIAE